jgi:DNA uptake protein ComE-like DNA-binding protein
MRTTFRTVVGLSLIALVTSPAMAQQGRGGFGRGGGLAALLGNESVQKELKLTDDQLGKAKETSEKITAEMREKFSGFQDLSPEERREKMTAINNELNESTLKAVGEYLKPEQITRLKQISYQQRGARAFSDPEVAKKLNITDAQKTELQTVLQDSMAKMGELRQEHGDDREAMMKAMAELNKETLAKAASKLNDEQQKTWKELIGSPFEVKYEPRPN